MKTAWARVWADLATTTDAARTSAPSRSPSIATRAYSPAMVALGVR